MSRIRFVIIDDSEDLCGLLRDYAEKHCGSVFSFVGAAHNGKDGFELITKANPDVALIDVIMPDGDGIDMLERLKQNPETRGVICVMLSAAVTDFAASRAQKAGADYFFMKPFDIPALFENIHKIYEYRTTRHNTTVIAEFPADSAGESKNNTPESFARWILDEIGVPSKYYGYKYIYMCLADCVDNPNLLELLTKDLYPRVAKEQHTSVASVERAMRYALDLAWRQGHPERYYQITGSTDAQDRTRPAIGVFLRSLARLYKSKKDNSKIFK